jgi:ABC-type antimicrobial peptide transport system permease subunit
LLATGVATGLPASWLLTKLVQSQLYGVEAHDPWTIGAAVVALAAIAAFAGFAPGRRATRIHPMEALRWE